MENFLLFKNWKLKKNDNKTFFPNTFIQNLKFLLTKSIQSIIIVFQNEKKNDPTLWKSIALQLRCICCHIFYKTTQCILHEILIRSINYNSLFHSRNLNWKWKFLLRVTWIRAKHFKFESEVSDKIDQKSRWQNSWEMGIGQGYFRYLRSRSRRAFSKISILKVNRASSLPRVS